MAVNSSRIVAEAAFDLLLGRGVAETGEHLVDPRVEAGLGAVAPVGVDGDGESLRHLHARPVQLGEPAHLGPAAATAVAGSTSSTQTMASVPTSTPVMSLLWWW